MSLRQIRVALHARAADLAGAASAGVEVGPKATAGEVKEALAALHPGLSGLLASCALANDREYLSDRTPLGDGTSFHLIPPVSGG